MDESDRLIAKKSLGQHFLRSESVLRKIESRIHEAVPKNVTCILEIGPGEGVLTSRLIKETPDHVRIVAIEKDRRSVALLAETFSQEIASKKLELIEGDVLDCIKNGYLAHLDKYAVIANIPYYITGALYEALLETDHQPAYMLFLVQEEVADRIIARDGKHSILSLSVHAYGIPKKIARVPRGAFVPPPRVESALLEIHSISKDRFVHHHVSEQQFFKLIKAGFAHKRKKLGSNIHSLVSKELVESLGSVRAEDVPLEQWFTIARSIQH